MAITNYKKQEELARQNGYTGSSTPYRGMAGVSQTTANNLGNYQQGYQQSDRVNQAQQKMQQIQNNRPQSYNSKYSAQLDSILQQIQNPGEFKYEFNGDNLFKGYADYYTQMGKQASLDAMGQAAGMTGGYGNSYGQMVGQQQYQQYLLPLYDKGMQLQQQAYQRYQDELANQKDLYGMLQQADQLDYGRFRDIMADWRQDEANATDLALRYEQMDRDAFNQELEYWTGLAQIENAAYNTEAERQEAIRQYNQDFAEKQRQYDTSMAEERRQYDTSLAEEQRQADLAERYRRDQLAEQIRGTDLDEAYRRDTLGEQIRQNDLDEAYRRDTLAENTRQYDTSLAEQIRQANLDEAYRRDTFGEQVRQNNLDEAYRRDQLAEQMRGTDLDEAYRRDTLAENIRQADLDEAYRRDQLAENIRSTDLDEAYRRDTFGWQQYTDARDYEQAVRENDRKYASNYALSILENGQMPSAELLMAAGLSAEDAAKLIKLIEQTGGAGSAGNTGNGNNGKDESFYDASVRVFKSEPETLRSVIDAREAKEKADQEKQEAKKETEKAQKDVTKSIKDGKIPTATELKSVGMTAADVVRVALGDKLSKATLSLPKTDAKMKEMKYAQSIVIPKNEKKKNQTK